MKLITNIRTGVGRFLLKDKAKKLKRNMTFHNLKSANSVGLVYLYKNEDEFKIVEKLIRQFREDKKEVKALVWLPYPKLLEYIPQKLSVDFITPNDLNFVQHPGGTRSNEFIATEFDILIDLNLENYFPLEYVTVLSKAQFKVGVFENNKVNVFDMMLKLPPNEKLEKVIEQSMNYLSMMDKA